MSDDADRGRSERLALPRDSFRSQRLAAVPATPVVVTPDYEDAVGGEGAAPLPAVEPRSRPVRRVAAKPAFPRNPFEGYGERSSSRPYALRLPDTIDLALRQIAAEERTHPLRIIDRILYDHLKRAGRLPPAEGA